MDSVPEGIIQHVLSQLSNARDIASSACVSKVWKDCIPFIPSLYFPRNAFDALGGIRAADPTITRMVELAVKLKELVVYCPFSSLALASWLALRGKSLHVLELRFDVATDKEGEDAAAKLDCIDAAKGLEVLRLWGVSMTRTPKWGSFQMLRILEIVGAMLRDETLGDAIRACPNVTDLALLGCDGASSVSIELQQLERCRLDFSATGGCNLFLSSPKVQVLEIHGFSWVRVHPKHHLKSLCIAMGAGRVYNVDVGKLVELEHLSLRGVQWSWRAVHSILERASEVNHLVMKIEFCGDSESLLSFPEIDLVEFFNQHPKLCRFEIHGAMFAALCSKKSLNTLDSRFVIPCLEEVVITVRSPLNAERKLSTLETLLNYSVKLRKLIIRISQMKNCHEAADDFFEEICKLKYMHQKQVQIE